VPSLSWTIRLLLGIEAQGLKSIRLPNLLIKGIRDAVQVKSDRNQPLTKSAEVVQFLGVFTVIPNTLFTAD